MKLEIGPGGRNGFEFDPRFCTECDVFMDIGPVHPQPRHFIMADAEHLPFKDEVFSHIMLNHVIEHLDDPKSAILEIYRVLKEDAGVDVYTPNFSYPGAKSAPGHKQIFNYFTLKNMLTQCGFKQIMYLPMGTKLLPEIFCKLILIFFYGELHAIGIKHKKKTHYRECPVTSTLHKDLKDQGILLRSR